jgi:hypothetical protein
MGDRNHTIFVQRKFPIKNYSREPSRRLTAVIPAILEVEAEGHKFKASPGKVVAARSCLKTKQK